MDIKSAKRWKSGNIRISTSSNPYKIITEKQQNMKNDAQ